MRCKTATYANIPTVKANSFKNSSMRLAMYNNKEFKT